MIVLTGATGNLGSEVLKSLLTLLPASSIAVSLSSPSAPPASLVSTGVQIRHGDYGQPASLEAAFAGAERLLLVSYPGISHHERVQRHKTAIDAAKAAGVKHVFYTSLAFAGDTCQAAVMQAHLETEAYLKQSELAYTILREGIYSESYQLYLGFFDPAKSDAEVVVPGDGGIAWASRQDLGEATARLLFQGGHEGETLLLSGPKAYTLAETAQIVSEVFGRPVSLRVTSEMEYVDAHKNASPSEDTANPRGAVEFLREWATTYTSAAKGELGVVTTDLRDILGREPKPFKETLEEMGKSKDPGAVATYAK